MASTFERSLSILEYLSTQPEGQTLSRIAADLEVPLSACHRLLTELARCGYVYQRRDHGEYAVTTKLAALGLCYLTGSGVGEIVQPILDRLAKASGELVRLAVVDGERLTFVAKAQGAPFGLRYDPDMGLDVRLSCSAGGHAWLMTLDDEQALALVIKQGFGDPLDYGPRAPTGWKAIVDILQEDRQRGFSMICDMYAPGMNALAAPVQRPGEKTVGAITIAGPALRLSESRMLALQPELLAAAAELAQNSIHSPLFERPVRNAASA
jgi:IclR family acetate operon transcriptional repressor